MAYIFMDESGCLGFDFTKAITSRYFVITLLMAKNDNVINNKAVSKIFKSIPKNELKVHCDTLHCYKKNDRTRIKLLAELKGLKDKDVSVMSIILNKQKVFDYLQNERRVYTII
ncbi:hypothetical protein AGMMS49532_06970 [Endomicrobiia bacterium]|nr:hypothetical protein AGMMS49532_06970 [Endomicrobiia bacterium]